MSDALKAAGQTTGQPEPRVARLNEVEHQTVADYRAARAAQPDGIIAMPGEPYATSERGGLKIYCRDGDGVTGWYHFAGDVFLPDGGEVL